MVQSVVARMASTSATIKNYSIAVATAICGFAITLQRPLAGLVAFLAVVAFALLDAQYLRLERRFRSVFERVRAEDWVMPPSFEINLSTVSEIRYGSALWCWSLVRF